MKHIFEVLMYIFFILAMLWFFFTIIYDFKATPYSIAKYSKQFNKIQTYLIVITITLFVLSILM